MAKVQSQSTSNPSSISQAAAVAALAGPQDIVRERCREFERRAGMIVDLLSGIPGLDCAMPEGAFFMFPDVGAFIGRKTPEGKTVQSDLDLATYLLEDAGVATVHGSAYGQPNRIRLSFAASDTDLRESCKRIREALTGLAS